MTLCQHVRNAVIMRVHDELCCRAQHLTRLLFVRMCLPFDAMKVTALSTFNAFDIVAFVIVRALFVLSSCLVCAQFRALFVLSSCSLCAQFVLSSCSLRALFVLHFVLSSCSVRA